MLIAPGLFLCKIFFISLEMIRFKQALTLTQRTIMDYDKVYQFLRKHYKHSRFEGMKSKEIPNYSNIVTNGVIDILEERGVCFISRHESYTGQDVKFDKSLNRLNEDLPPELRSDSVHNTGNLTHLF